MTSTLVEPVSVKYSREEKKDSNSSSSSLGSSASLAREEVRRLQKEKDELEKKIAQVSQSIPMEFRNIRQKPRYLDRDGFPRDDINITKITKARKQLLLLQNDHVNLMKRIEKLVILAFQTQSQSHSQSKSNEEDEREVKLSDDNGWNQSSARQQQQQQSGSGNPLSSLRNPSAMKGFYVVGAVASNSPAQEAGLKTGDVIIQFGSMIHSNQSTQLMQSIVKRSVNRIIPVVVKRNPEGYVPLNLMPKRWEGRGLLGCHLKPYNVLN